jgi:urease accessory protein
MIAEPSHPDKQVAGWQAHLELGFSVRAQRTELTHRRGLGPLKVQRSFHPEGDVCHAYLLHPPGGVVGGDGLMLDVQVEEGASALLSAPGATKCYRSAGARSEICQQFRVAEQGRLEWLPHETILFSGCEIAVRNRVELADGARFLGWELLCLGRPAGDVPFLQGRADVGLEVLRAGRPLLCELLRLTPDRIARPVHLRGAPVLATLLATPADAVLRDALRAALQQGNNPALAGGMSGSTPHAPHWEQPGDLPGDLEQRGDLLEAVTLLAEEDLLVLRVLGPSTERVRQRLELAWRCLREPVMGRVAVAPRIWAT